MNGTDFGIRGTAAAYADGRLSDIERAAVERHLASNRRRPPRCNTGSARTRR